MSQDTTENARRVLTDLINMEPDERAAMEKAHGQVWDTKQLQEDFEVIGFQAPYVVVKRKSDGVKGSLIFQHMPRYYFAFQAD